MAGQGPPPAERRRRRNADPHASQAVTVPADAPPVQAPPLPYASRYKQATRVWYRTWCEAPQAAAFTVTDWQRLHMLAPIVDGYWRAAEAADAKGCRDLLGEIRLSESLLGATHADRLRGRITIERPKPTSARPAVAGGGDSGEVTDLTARRRRLADGA
ncbi:hypothetical protein [Parafrankia sp. EUN1f]|uniref:phage terminase small subunit n=1 Tax=Parafrankia sp. EUN1f TaxID=102897 RepID=UPI0001C43F90|nr:hypothetical protein [Parafrankia sp. EUN1f]EFC79235.1 hypothetical protein FrEUN1fDRAFT_7651 [Parafrankia sp. EUN1f]